MFRHHPTLQPLRTRPDTPIDPRRRNFSHSFGSSSRSTAPLPSPTFLAARAYYQEQGTPIGPWADALERRRSLIEGHQLPRRHSVMATTGTLVSQLKCFSFGPPTGDLHPVPEAQEVSPKIQTEGNQAIVMTGPKQDAIVRASAGVSPEDKDICGTFQGVIRQVPFDFTHEHLKDWGYAYLGNGSTADAFVNSVHLKRPSLLSAESDQSQVESSHLVTIRARILPRGKDKKPFLIQRQCDINGLRASIPKSQIQEQVGNTRSTGPKTLRRSSRARRSSVQPFLDVTKRRGSVKKPQAKRLSSLGDAAIPIRKTYPKPRNAITNTRTDIEYALHYLPVLAALMLSGHVRKGDSIDLPLPHPEAWSDVVTYIYTGSNLLTPKMKENIQYLAGHA
jgi:hypothetical protein